MQHTKTNDGYLLVFKRGERVMETLTAFLHTNQISSAWLSGLGAVDELRVGYYDLAARTYRFTDYHEPLEVVSLCGNVVEREGAPLVHAHGVFSNTKNETIGGHIEEMRVAVTFELRLSLLGASAQRVHDDETGLPLITPREE